MTREQNRAALEDLIYLVSCAVKETVPEKGRSCRFTECSCALPAEG